MATLTLEIGPLTSSINADNGRAQAVFEAICDAHGYDGDPADNQAKLDFVAADIVAYLTNAARGYKADQAAMVAHQAALEDPENQFTP